MPRALTPPVVAPTRARGTRQGPRVCGAWRTSDRSRQDRVRDRCLSLPWSAQTQPAITRASMKLGSAPSRPRRCAPTARAHERAASGLDGACAQLRDLLLRDGRQQTCGNARQMVEFDAELLAAVSCEHLVGVGVTRHHPWHRIQCMPSAFLLLAPRARFNAQSKLGPCVRSPQVHERLLSDFGTGS